MSSANKMARIAFAIMRGTTVYGEIPAEGAPLEFEARQERRCRGTEGD
jgi:hypothetical protein